MLPNTIYQLDVSATGTGLTFRENEILEITFIVTTNHHTNK